jgi:hypothetical protein
VRAEPSEHLDPGAVGVARGVQRAQLVGIVVAAFPGLVIEGHEPSGSGLRPTRTAITSARSRTTGWVSGRRSGGPRPAPPPFSGSSVACRSTQVGEWSSSVGSMPCIHARTVRASKVSVVNRVTWAAARSRCSRHRRTDLAFAFRPLAGGAGLGSLPRCSRGLSVPRRKAPAPQTSRSAPWMRRGNAVATNGTAAGATGRQPVEYQRCVSAGQRHKAGLDVITCDGPGDVRFLHAPHHVAPGSRPGASSLTGED